MFDAQSLGPVMSRKSRLTSAERKLTTNPSVREGKMPSGAAFLPGTLRRRAWNCAGSEDLALTIAAEEVVYMPSDVIRCLQCLPVTFRPSIVENLIQVQQ
ncbi:MAG: hypothetical protein EOQ89_26520 [Mesorhizobium sp.]|nr:MAG: hypothetical protein EOQ89_26520 [Mesorhizobium sp.]